MRTPAGEQVLHRISRSVFKSEVARFEIGHTRRKFPAFYAATSRFIAYLVQSRLIIISRRGADCKHFFQKCLKNCVFYEFL